MTKTEIINETASYYLTNNRGIHAKGGCSYYTDGNMCAVGRCIDEPEKLANSGLFVKYLIENNKISFKEQYKGYEVEFWRQLQLFHDCGSHWEAKLEGKGNTLTHYGQSELEELLKNWENK